eukprot:TRINITY_DN3103_c0_g1_i11.p3 TRINITY_DN3103_c0_g1~~TRINITY_DN3103_c0_g1_i11.p3  ORF type:complete len:235 (+),score=20.25 TRINITY_DN3103_c0_g1_i11:245-949(+)
MGNQQTRVQSLQSKERRCSTQSTTSTRSSGTAFSDDDWRSTVTAQFVKLSEESEFTVQEVVALNEIFVKVSSRNSPTGQITQAEFNEAIVGTMDGNLFMDRVFYLFDKKQTGVIDFEEFVQALSIFHPRTSLLEKACFSFNIFDIDCCGEIKAEDIKQFMGQLFSENTSGIVLSERVIDTIIDNTIRELAKGMGLTITLQEWFSYILERPTFIGYMSIPSLLDLVPNNAGIKQH